MSSIILIALLVLLVIGLAYVQHALFGRRVSAPPRSAIPFPAGSILQERIES